MKRPSQRPRRIAVHLESPALNHWEPFSRMARAALEAVVLVNRVTMRLHRVPPLYESGVRYENEPRGTESFVDCSTVLKRGFGDCAHLCAYRVAELRERGEPAALRITFKRLPGKRLFHVQVRRHSGGIEDPSRRLGMGKRQPKRTQ